MIRKQLLRGIMCHSLPLLKSDLLAKTGINLLELLDRSEKR